MNALSHGRAVLASIVTHLQPAPRAGWLICVRWTLCKEGLRVQKGKGPLQHFTERASP